MRSTKTEIRNKLEIRMFKTYNWRFLSLEIQILKLFRISIFEFRFSDLVKLVRLFSRRFLSARRWRARCSQGV